MKVVGGEAAVFLTSWTGFSPLLGTLVFGHADLFMDMWIFLHGAGRCYILQLDFIWNDET